MNILNNNRFTHFDVIMAVVFFLVASDYFEQSGKDEASSDIVYTEDFAPHVTLRLQTAEAGDSIFSLCRQMWSENIRPCARLFVLENREKFPEVLDSEDDFYLIKGEDYLIPVR